MSLELDVFIPPLSWADAPRQGTIRKLLPSAPRYNPSASHPQHWCSAEVELSRVRQRPSRRRAEHLVHDFPDRPQPMIAPYHVFIDYEAIIVPACDAWRKLSA